MLPRSTSSSVVNALARSVIGRAAGGVAGVERLKYHSTSSTSVSSGDEEKFVHGLATKIKLTMPYIVSRDIAHD